MFHDGCQHALRFGVISRIVTVVRVGHGPVRFDQEHAALLHGVSLYPRLLVTGTTGLPGTQESPWVENSEQVSLGAHGAVSRQIGICVNWDIAANLAVEPLRLLGTAVAQDNDFGAGMANLGNDITQLRDLLQTKDSAEVPDHGQKHGPLRPKAPK